MKYNVPMPSLGADMDQGKLMQWLVKPGDEVKKGQTIAVVETTKSTVEIESFRNGKVLELVGKEGDEIKVGEVIAHFEVAEEKGIQPAAPPPRIKASPTAKRLAQEQGLDLALIKGSGPEGIIELKDVQTFLEAKKVVPAKASRGSNLREAIAKAMSRSKKEIPHYYLKTRVNLDNFMEWIDEKNQILPPNERLLIPTLFMRAIVLALRENPVMNGYYVNEKFEQKASIHLGVAVSLKNEGVLVPAILDAEGLSLLKLNAAFQDLLLRTRKGEIKNRELTEGTFTVTNLGDLGSHEVFGIIFPPQVALVGLGSIHKEAVVSKSGIHAGFVIDITLSADHRVTDGLSGARFLASVEKYLSGPNLLEDKDEQSANKKPVERDLPADRTGYIV